MRAAHDIPKRMLLLSLGFALLCTPFIAVFATLDLLEGELGNMPFYLGWGVISFVSYFVARKLIQGGGPGNSSLRSSPDRERIGDP